MPRGEHLVDVLLVSLLLNGFINVYTVPFAGYHLGLCCSRHKLSYMGSSLSVLTIQIISMSFGLVSAQTLLISPTK